MHASVHLRSGPGGGNDCEAPQKKREERREEVLELVDVELDGGGELECAVAQQFEVARSQRPQLRGAVRQRDVDQQLVRDAVDTNRR